MTSAGSDSAARVARNTVLQAGADAVGKLGTIVLYAVMAREAGIAAFGDFTTAASLAILMMVAAFGMDYRITRLIARGEDGLGAAFWSAIVLKLALGLVLLGALVGVAILGPYSDRVVLATLLLGLAILAELAMLTPHAVFRGLERLAPVAVALLIYRGLLSVVGVVLLLTGASITAVAGGWLACSLLALAYSAARLVREDLHVPWSVSLRSLREVGLDSFALGLAGVLGAVLARVDIVLIGLLRDSEAVALYGAAYRLTESAQFLTTALALSSFPALARLSRTSVPSVADATGFAIKIVLLVTLPLGLAFVLWAEPLMNAFYGSAFSSGDTTLRLLAPIVVLAGVVGLINFVLSAQQRQRPILLALGVGTVVNIGANLLLIPRHGPDGAAVAMLATAAVMSVTLLVPTIGVTGPIELGRVVAAPVMATLAAAGTAAATGTGPLSALALLLVFPLAFVVVERALHPRDLERILQIVRRRTAGPNR